MIKIKLKKRTMLKESIDKQQFSNFLHLVEPQEEIVEKYFYKNITPLQTHKITKLLGEGVEGAAFLLDNGNVLKIAKVVAIRDANSAEYKRSSDSLFSGKGNAHDLMVYDQGKFIVPYSEYKTLMAESNLDFGDMGFSSFSELPSKIKKEAEVTQQSTNDVEFVWAEMTRLITAEKQHKMSYFDMMTGNIELRAKNRLARAEILKAQQKKEPLDNKLLSDIYNIYVSHGMVRDTLNDFPELRKHIATYVVNTLRRSNFDTEFLSDFHLGNVGYYPNDRTKLVAFDF